MDRKGAALALVLLIVVVVVILANVAMAIMSSQNRFTHHQVNRLRAYYAAQGAMNIAFERLRGGVTDSFSHCPTIAACNTPGPPLGGNSVIDADIPFRVDVTVGAAGTSIDGTGRQITITTDYTPQ